MGDPVQTQCLSLSLPCAELVRKDDDPGPSDRASGRDHVAFNAQSVRPVEALCEMLSGMPAGVDEIGLGFADDRQPLRLRMRLRLPSDPSEQSSYDEVSFASADELANSVQHLAGDYDLRIRVVRDRHDDYVLVRLVLLSLGDVQHCAPTAWQRCICSALRSCTAVPLCC